MRRRAFLALIGGAAIAWPLTGHAQPSGRVYRIAILHPSNPVAEMRETGSSPYYRSFFKELRRLGYVEGHNLVVDRRSGEGRAERYREIAHEVVRLGPDAIFASSGLLVQLLKDATSTIPIVSSTGDPIALGLVDNLARRSNNITGVSIDAGVELLTKRLEVLKEAVPTISKVAFLGVRRLWEGSHGRLFQETAQRMGMSAIGASLDNPIQEPAYRHAFAAMAEAHVDAVMVTDLAEHVTYRSLIAELAEQARLPAVYPVRSFVEVGGLMAYAVDLADAYGRSASIVDQILRGQKPGDIPIQQASKFELVINLKTAKALNIEIPFSLLVRADEVIE